MFPPYNPKTWTPAMLAAPMMIPAIMTPRETDSAVVLMPMSRNWPRGFPSTRRCREWECRRTASAPRTARPDRPFSSACDRRLRPFPGSRKRTSRYIFIRAPVQHLPGEEIDQRHRQHIAHDAHRKRRPVVQIHANGHNDTARSSTSGTMDTKKIRRYLANIPSP